MRFNRQGPRRGLHRHASAREEGGGAHSHRGLKQSFVVVVNALIIIIIIWREEKGKLDRGNQL